MFDEQKALKLLQEDRREYIRKAIMYAQSFLDRNMDDLAANTIVEAARGLCQLDGSLQYVKRLANFKEDEYPRFNTLLE